MEWYLITKDVDTAQVVDARTILLYIGGGADHAP